MSVAYPGATAYPAEGAPQALFVLAHGAGAGQGHPFMVATARGLAMRGIDVVTFDFPYMKERRGVPDRPPVLEQSFREAIAAARQWSRAGTLFIGGKSMGGRMATHLAASASAGAAVDEQVVGLSGVVALGYPLHPPGKPQQLRTAHLPDIVVSVLIVQGERDTFGTPAELEPAIAAMKAPVTLHVVAGGDHSLTVRGKKGAGVHDAVLDVIHRWMTA